MAAQAESPTGQRGGIMDFRFSILDFPLKSWLARVVLSVSVLAPSLVSGQQPAKIPFPYGPMGLNSMPWIVAKESNLFTENGGLRGKKVGLTRFGAVTNLALRALLERNNIKDVTILQMGGLAEAMAGLSKGSVDGAVVSPPHTLSLLKQGFRELVSPGDL